MNLNELDDKVIRSSDIFDHFKEEKDPFRFIEKKVKIEVPSNFDHKKRVKEFMEKGINKERKRKKRRQMTVEERAQLLGEDGHLGPNPNLTAKTKQFMKRLSKHSKHLLMNAKQFILSSDQSINSNVERIWEDPHKNERYSVFVLKKEGKFSAPIRYPLGFRASNIKVEIEEFEKVFKKKQSEKQTDPKSKAPGSEKEKLLFKIEELKEKIKKKKRERVIEDWIPNRILCIRFHVQQPKKTIIRKEKDESNLDFNNDILPLVRQDLARTKRREDEALEEVEKGPIYLMPDENNVELERPDIDLFESIFNDI